MKLKCPNCNTKLEVIEEGKAVEMKKRYAVELRMQRNVVVQNIEAVSEEDAIQQVTDAFESTGDVAFISSTIAGCTVEGEDEEIYDTWVFSEEEEEEEDE
jgi:hypothetical protein